MRSVTGATKKKFSELRFPWQEMTEEEMNQGTLISFRICWSHWRVASKRVTSMSLTYNSWASCHSLQVLIVAYRMCFAILLTYTNKRKFKLEYWLIREKDRLFLWEEIRRSQLVCLVKKKGLEEKITAQLQNNTAQQPIFSGNRTGLVKVVVMSGPGVSWELKSVWLLDNQFLKFLGIGVSS